MEILASIIIAMIGIVLIVAFAWLVGYVADKFGVSK